MLVRFYVAPQAGDGTYNDPYSSILNQMIDPSVGEGFTEVDCPSRHISMCYVWAGQATHDNIASDSRVIAVSPLYQDAEAVTAGLNTLLSSIPGAATVKEKLETIGISTSWISGSNTLRDAVRYLLRVFAMSQMADFSHDSNVRTFIANNLDTTIKDVPLAIREAVKTWMQSRGLAIGWITNTTTVREVLHFIVINLGFGKMKLSGQEF